MNVFKNILYFFSALLAAFFLWSIINFYLPKTAPIFIPEIKLKKFYKINLSHLFFANSNSIKPISSTPTKPLKGVKLKAIYKSNKKTFIVLEKNKKTYFLNINDKFEGYKLIKVEKNEAIFEKNNKQYKVSFEKIKDFKITNSNTPIAVKKETFEYYKNHLSEIWKNIGIIKTFDGYKITYIKPNSIFQKIGLKRGDIILEVNNIPLKKDTDAWRAYNTIQDYPEITIKIKRNSKLKVLKYEME